MTSSRSKPEPRLDSTLADLLARVPHADMAVLSATEPRPAAVLSHTDERARALETDQLRSGRGPCVEVARSGRPVLADTSQIRTYWPDFVRRARELRVHGLLAMPIRSGPASGVLSLYACRSHAFDEHDEDVAHLFASVLTARAPTALGTEEGTCRTPTATGRPSSSRPTSAAMNSCARSRS